MGGAVAIRVARPDEWTLLAPIERAADERYRTSAAPELTDRDVVPDDVARRYAADGRVLVAETAGGTGGTSVVGFVAWHREADPTCFGIAQISVLPDHGGRGIGTVLMRHAIDLARTGDFERVTLNTQRNVPWNEPWYLALGFQPVAPADWAPFMRAVVDRQRAIGIDWSTRTWMQLPLRSANGPTGNTTGRSGCHSPR